MLLTLEVFQSDNAPYHGANGSDKCAFLADLLGLPQYLPDMPSLRPGRKGQNNMAVILSAGPQGQVRATSSYDSNVSLIQVGTEWNAASVDKRFFTAERSMVVERTRP
jgi:hypothetical protein